MQKELIRFIIGKRGADDPAVERRIKIYDRRTLRTYIENDRRSGVADRRAKNFEIIKKLLLGYNRERRHANRDRRNLNTYIENDRRSGISDRRSGS